ncbi:hypothetical protein IFM89_022514 [Coptis chinensis]|uniref:Germin-like protein n=1 Tax=Coptis chinensis TaxID=261450 RepID=A0A835IF53_9MAGN|nr:hypothetical protein IFM89_022514 [Coptis chinensis]
MCKTLLAEAWESYMFFPLTSHEKNKYAKKPEIEPGSPVQAAPSHTVDSHDASTFMPVMAYSTSSTDDLFVGKGCNMELNYVDWDSPPTFDVCPEEEHDSFLDTPPIFYEYGADESEFCVTTPSLFGNLFVKYADTVWEDFDINYTRLFSSMHLKLQLEDPKLATTNDFFFGGGHHLPGNTSNQVGSVVTPAFVAEFPGLNTLGISLVCIDFAPNGVNPLHTHPRASEILICMEGTLYVRFVTSNPDYRLMTKVLHQGEAFVFPKALFTSSSTLLDKKVIDNLQAKRWVDAI